MSKPNKQQMVVTVTDLGDDIRVEVAVGPNMTPEMLYAAGQTLQKTAIQAAQAGGTDQLAVEGGHRLEFDSTAGDDDGELN